MKKLIGLLALCFVISLPALAQRHEGGGGRPEVGGGRQNIPKRGPARVETPRAPEEHRTFNEKEGHPNAPHVDRGRQWVGHDSGRGDPESPTFARRGVRVIASMPQAMPTARPCARAPS